jgi:hypothetical protein
MEEAYMKFSIALSALLVTGFVAASTEQASAVITANTSLTPPAAS